MLHIYFLGGLTLTWDKLPLPSISNVAARSLLAYLVTYRDRSHTRDLLSGLFWPDLPETVARRRLSRALWEIQRALRLAQSIDDDSPAQSLLLTHGDTVQFNPDFSFWLDVQEFNQLLNRELRDHNAHLPLLRQAVELYQGDFLSGYYDDWLLVERERLRESFLTALEQLTVSYKSRGEYEQALFHARRLTLENPWREKAHREVMRLCHLLERDKEALKQFETCRQVLAEELDAKPSLETLNLVREIATRNLAGSSDQGYALDLPQASPLPDAIILDSAHAPELPLVGRERARAELLTHVQALLQGLGGVVLLEGEAGVGKTRLLQTVARDAKWRGAEVLWGEAHEIQPTAPYGPLVEALTEGLSPLRASQLAQLVERIWLQSLAALLPPLAAEIPDLVPPPDLAPSQERDRLVAALAQLLAGWGRIKPLLVVLENLHWFGEDALDVLARLAPALNERGVLLIGSLRGEDARALPEVWQKLQALDRAGVRRRLVLSGLDAEATGELVRRCLGMRDPALLFEARLYQETKGNPLFVLETLRALHGEGLLARDADGQWSTPWDETTDDYAELPLPLAVEQTIARRLDFVSPALQETLRLAAVLGERFAFNLLHAAAHGESPPLLLALRELVQRRFLDETDRDYRFSHDKIRQVVYEGLDEGERASLHHQAAQALESLQPERVAALAYHWTRAGAWDRAAQYHRQAGDRARAVYANAEAANHYSRALQALERLTEPENLLFRFQLHLDRESVYTFLSRRDAQAKDLAALASLVRRLDDEAQEAQVALRRGMYADTSGDLPAAIEAAQQAVRLARAAGDVQLEAEGQRQWGRALTRQGAFQDARSRLEAALALAQCHSLPVVEAASLIDLGTISGRQGNYERASRRYEQALGLLRQAGDRQGEAAVLNNLGLVARLQEDYAGARAFHEQSAHVRREIGDWQGEIRVLNNLAIICRHQGDYAQAKLYFEQVMAFQQEIGERWYESRALNNLGMTLLNLGDYADAEARFEQSLRISREIGGRSSEAEALEGLGRVLYHRGDEQAAREYLLAALRLARDLGERESQQFKLTSLGHALTGLGRLAEAADAYHQALALQRELGRQNMTMESLAGLARLCLAQGSLTQARDHVAEILAYLDGGGSLDGTEEPVLIFLTCYQVLHTVQDPRAGAILDTGHRLLQERAAKIPDKATRRSFLENVAAHREIVAVYRELQGRRVAARLPRTEAPTGRPLRDDEYVTVAWTVDAPEDATLHNKVARRRRRLLRLLQEAQAQGAAPTHRHLAQALGVSQRTIERDVVALRQKYPHVPPTRGVNPAKKMSE